MDSAFPKVTNVYGLGAGQGGADDTAIIQAAADRFTNGGELYFPAGYDYNFAGTVDLSAGDITVNIRKGAVITQHVDAPAFKAEGALGSSQLLTSNVTAGVRTCTVADASIYPNNSWIYVASSNTLSGTTDKLATIRQVVSKTATTITVGRSFHRSMFTAQTAHIRPVTLIPGIRIIGGGQIKHIDSTNEQMLIDLILCEEAFVEVELGPSGGPGLTVSHCIGGGTLPQFHARDLRDDGEGFGYGINCAGASMHMTFYGKTSRCRHGFTTNVGPVITNSANYGEPLDIDVYLTANNCSNKAMDTHRAGWGINFKGHVIGGSSGGVQIRADACSVTGMVIGGPNSVGIAVTSDVAVPCLITGVNISETAGTGGTAILLQGPAIVRNPYFYRFSGIGIDVQAVGCQISDQYIDGVGTGTLKGIKIGAGANNTRIRGGYITRCGTGIEVAAGVTGTEYSTVDFGTNTANVTLL
jgi:hypothetical protein